MDMPSRTVPASCRLCGHSPQGQPRPRRCDSHPRMSPRTFPFELSTGADFMPYKDKGHLAIEDRATVLVVRVDGGPHQEFGVDLADKLDRLVKRVDRDPGVRAVVFTGAHPER